MIERLNENDKRVYALVRNRIIHGLGMPKLREINEITGKSSPRSAVLALQRLEGAGLVKRNGKAVTITNSFISANASVSTINIPLVGVVAAGTPILAEQNIAAMIPVSTALAHPGSKYFFLRIFGDSMNLAKRHGIALENGSFVLVRQQNTANNDEIVVALINDEATVKFFEKKGNIVILKPKSSNPKHKPIVLTENCIIQGVVVATLPQNTI